MGQLRFAALLLLLVLGLSGCVSTGPSPTPGTTTIADVNRLSGVHVSLRSLKRDILNAASHEGQNSSAAFRSAWRKSSVGLFEGQRMIVAVEQRIGGRLSQADLDSVADFYGSPVGRKIVAAEIRASDVRGKTMAEKALRLYEGLQRSDPARLALYRTLIRAGRSEQILKDVTTAVLDAVAAGVTSSIRDTAFRRQIRTKLREAKAEIAKYASIVVLVGAAYGYRDLSDDDLNAYAAFLRSTAGRRYFDALVPAFRSVVASEARAFGRAFGEAITSR